MEMALIIYFVEVALKITTISLIEKKVNSIHRGSFVNNNESRYFDSFESNRLTHLGTIWLHIRIQHCLLLSKQQHRTLGRINQIC